MITTILDKDGINRLTGAVSRGELEFYQFYNFEFGPDEYNYQQYMTQFTEGDPSQKILNKSYYDIEIDFIKEVFPDPEKAAFPVNAIAVYNNIRNEAVIFALPGGCNIKDQDILDKGVNDLYNEICEENETYSIKDIHIKVRTFEKEINLLKAFFEYIRELNTLFLIGFNSSLFDDPYVVNRGVNLIGEDIYNDISEFGEVSKFGSKVYSWPDYILLDILKLYKPVDSGGSGFGKSLPNFKLDTVAEYELGIKKLDLEDMTWEYKNNIVRFLTYNLLDTLLTFKIDEKLRFLELQWTLCKLNDAPISSAINGRSIMYKIRNNLIYTRRNQIIRSKLFNREIMYPLE